MCDHQIVADSQEDGHSIWQTVDQLNAHGMENGDKMDYTYSSVYSCIKKLRPKADKLRTRSSGSTDID